MMGAVVKVALAAYMILIFFLSVGPGPASLPEVWQIDKLYHFLAYALMAFLWAWTFAVPASEKKGESISVRALTAAFVISTLFGSVMEIIQQFSSSRKADLFDAAANAIGAFAGVLIAGWALKVFERRSSKMQTRGG